MLLEQLRAIAAAKRCVRDGAVWTTSLQPGGGSVALAPDAEVSSSRELIGYSSM